MAELFGFKFERIKNTSSQEKFTEPSSDDGTIETAGGGFMDNFWIQMVENELNMI